MENSCEVAKKKLNRIAGQVTGIQKMIESNREITEIIQQISAARAALSGVALELLRDDAKSCLQDTKNTQEKLKDFEKLVEHLFKIDK